MKHKNTATVDCSALIENYHTIEKLAAPAEVICVVKADAYGHGIEAVSEALGAAGCGFFAVSSEEEAQQLRLLEQARRRHPRILILGHIDPDNVGAMLENDIICTVVSAENGALLSRAVADYNREKGENRSLRIHVKLDTGMNRVGFSATEEDAAETVRAIVALSRDPSLHLEGLFTHFSCADEELMDHKEGPAVDLGGSDSYTAMQLKRYKTVLGLLTEAGVDVGLRHAANSAATLCLPEAAFDAVRAGVILYGLTPNGTVDPRFKPVMRFESTVTHVHKVGAGRAVSYGGAYIAEKDSLVATVAAGYADGFLRAFTGCYVTIRGHRVPQIGRICMDQFMVDITDCPQVAVGDRVILFGGDDGSAVNALARIAGTINYEIVCGVSKRVVRIPEYEKE